MKKLLLLTTIAFLSATPVFATDLTQPLKTFDGNEFVGNDGKPLGLTLGIIIENSLLSEQAANTEEKNQNFWLALKVHEHAKDFSPTPEDLVRIKKALGATQATAVYGQVLRAIDGSFKDGSK